ncbi:MAG TPA: cysteine desulfurase [Saprospiraceae bacterium]|nr:cysteine desulfurase [Saprospiraceae bacterium]
MAIGLKELEVNSLDIKKVRSDFPILSRRMNGQPLVFLDSAASSQKPVQVIEAISNYYIMSHANVHRGVYQLSQEATEAFESTRRAVRDFIQARSEVEIIFVRGCTEGINLVAHSFGKSEVHPGDIILISGLEHHSNIVPWQMLCQEREAQLRVIPVLDNGELDMEAYWSLLNEKVKLVAVNHVSNSLGTVNPIKKMIAMAHQWNIPVLVDGAQAVPHEKVDVSELDADFYVFSGHKMYGPTGIGILYGKEKWLEKLPPYQGGGEMISTVTFEKTTYNELPFKFEAGTPDIAGGIGLHAAIQYLNHLGMEAIKNHESELLMYGTEQLSSLKDLQLIGTAPHKTGVFSFLVNGLHPYDIGSILDKQGIAVRTGHHCTQPLMDRFRIPGTVRASLGLYNNSEDIDRLVEGLDKAITMLK